MSWLLRGGLATIAVAVMAAVVVVIVAVLVGTVPAVVVVALAALVEDLPRRVHERVVEPLPDLPLREQARRDPPDVGDVVAGHPEEAVVSLLSFVDREHQAPPLDTGQHSSRRKPASGTRSEGPGPLATCATMRAHGPPAGGFRTLLAHARRAPTAGRPRGQ